MARPKLAAIEPGLRAALDAHFYEVTAKEHRQMVQVLADAAKRINAAAVSTEWSCGPKAGDDQARRELPGMVAANREMLAEAYYFIGPWSRRHSEEGPYKRVLWRDGNATEWLNIIR